MIDLLFKSTTFTRSDGTVFARIYERLTKASRRRGPGPAEGGYYADVEAAYRQGVKDALEALRDELA